MPVHSGHILAKAFTNCAVPSQIFLFRELWFFGHANQKVRQLALVLRDDVEVSDLHLLWCMAERYAFRHLRVLRREHRSDEVNSRKHGDADNSRG